MSKKNRIFEALSMAGVVAIAVLYFLVSRAGFFTGDDLAGMERIHTMADNIEDIKELYMNWGGRLFSWFFSNIFIRILDDKLWLDIFNTFFFVLLLLFGTLLANEGKQRKDSFFPQALTFGALFWLLCPSAASVLFWPAGSSCYLWPTTFMLLFLWLFLHFKDKSLPLWENLLFLALAMLSATNEIPCIGICAALLLHVIVHRKSMTKTAWFMAVGFVLGSVACVLAPGNFARSGTGGGESSMLTMLKSMLSPMRVVHEMLKLKAFWLLLAGLLVWFFRDRRGAVSWCRENLFVLTALVVSLLSCLFLFSLYNDSGRYLVFSETMAMVLIVRMVVDVAGRLEKPSERSKRVMAACLLSALFVACVVDACNALAATKRQHAENERMMEEIRQSGGVLALETHESGHRMAVQLSFPQWTWKPVAYLLGLDSVHVYPAYCLDKYWGDPLDSGAGYCVTNDMVVIRHPVGMFPDGVDCTIEYNRPKKWYKTWLDRLTGYQYARTSHVDKGAPDFCFEGFCYYGFYMKSENCRGITAVAVKERENGLSSTK